MTQLPIFLSIFIFLPFSLPQSFSSEDTRCPRSQICTERTSCPWYQQKWEELKALDRRSFAYRNLIKILKAKVCNKIEKKVCCCTGASGSCSILDESELDSGRRSVLFPEEGETRCCPKKVVAGNSTIAGEYILEGEFPAKVHEQCKDNCIYTKDGKDFCFGKLQPTDFTVQCPATGEVFSGEVLVLIPWTYLCEHWYGCYTPLRHGCRDCNNWGCYFWRNKCCPLLQPICANQSPPVTFYCQHHC